MSAEFTENDEIHEDESKETRSRNTAEVSEDTLKDLVNVSCLLQEEIPNMRKRIEWLELSSMALVLLICMSCMASLGTSPSYNSH